MDRWVGRVAIVTGASSGIGASIARALVKRGMRVVAMARREDRLHELAVELEEANGELHPFKGDVTNEDDIKKIVQWSRENLGGADVLVNNAGSTSFRKLTDLEAADIDKILGVNVKGLSLLTKEVVRDMRSRGVDDGHIFHINSVLGHTIFNFPGLEMYTASKHAVTVLTECLRRELRDLGSKIRITSISPGCVRTEIAIAGGLSEEASAKYMEGPVMEPEDIADALKYALSAPPHVQVHEIQMNPTGR